MVSKLKRQKGRVFKEEGTKMKKWDVYRPLETLLEIEENIHAYVVTEFASRMVSMNTQMIFMPMSLKSLMMFLTEQLERFKLI